MPAYTGPPILSGSDPAVVAAACAAHGLTAAEFAALRAGAVSAKALAYCPYSKFRVGAALLPLEADRLPPASAGAGAGAEGGEQLPGVIRGCNVENASYPVTVCAERCGFGAAVAQGITTFKALSVATDISPPASPCGMCRQAIREFCLSDMPVVMFDKNEDFIILTVEEILPLSFGPDQLPPPGAPGTM